MFNEHQPANVHLEAWATYEIAAEKAIENLIKVLELHNRGIICLNEISLNKIQDALVCYSTLTAEMVIAKTTYGAYDLQNKHYCIDGDAKTI